MKATASCYNTFVAFLEPECKASPTIENLWSLLITKAAHRKPQRLKDLKEQVTRNGLIFQENSYQN